jgi:glycyl-tRNA synthetase beta chain
VDEFFEKVLVMAPDDSVRGNRLSLLSHLVGLFRSVADLSQLQG